jgi:hypothetical protein
MTKRTLGFIASLAMVVAAIAGTGGLSAQAGEPDHFELFFVSTNNTGAGVLARYTFDEPMWQFGDRPGYRCAWALLMSGGVPIARVQFDRGQNYTLINDKFGDETTNDFSQCIEPGELEVKPKPAGLADTIVDFKLGGSTITSLTFPATSPENPDSWWELEEGESDEVEIELYWTHDVAVIATLTSLSPNLTFSVRSTGAPKINNVQPLHGGPGTVVDIAGANFVDVKSVTFGGTAANFEVESAGEITATVPQGASDGPIAVTTSAGTGTSATDFSVGAIVTHASKVTLKLSGHLVASGVVRALDGTDACVDDRTVVIQRRANGHWRNRGKDQTGTAGNYRERIKNKGGLYRAKVKKKTLANGEQCLVDFSKKHRPQ